MSTPQLGLGHITGSQANKETTANAAFDGLDNAMNALLGKAVTGDVTLTSAEFKACQFVQLTGAPGSPFTLAIPASIKKVFSVHNNTGQTLTIECVSAASTGQSLSAGQSAIFYSDGGEIYLLGATPTAATSYDVGMFIQGVPGSEELVFRYVVVTAFTLPTNCSGSQAKAKTGSTGTLRYTIAKNAASIGHIQFAASAIGTFSTTQTSFAVGDILTITADEYGDVDTLADISITLKGTR